MDKFERLIKASASNCTPPADFVERTQERLGIAITRRRYQKIAGALTAATTALLVWTIAHNHVVSLLQLAAARPAGVRNHLALYLLVLGSSVPWVNLAAAGLAAAGLGAVTKSETIVQMLRRNGRTKQGVSTMSLKWLGGLKAGVVAGGVITASLTAAATFAQFKPQTVARVQAQQQELAQAVNGSQAPHDVASAATVGRPCIVSNGVTNCPPPCVGIESPNTVRVCSAPPPPCIYNPVVQVQNPNCPPPPNPCQLPIGVYHPQPADCPTPCIEMGRPGTSNCGNPPPQPCVQMGRPGTSNCGNPPPPDPCQVPPGAYHSQPADCPPPCQWNGQPGPSQPASSTVYPCPQPAPQPAPSPKPEPCPATNSTKTDQTVCAQPEPQPQPQPQPGGGGTVSGGQPSPQ